MENESKIKKVLFNEVSLTLSIIAATFWVFTYLNSPITKIQLDVELMKKDIQIITEAHLIYNDNANKRDEAIIQIQQDLAVIKSLLKR